MTAVLADTHSVVWWLTDSALLSEPALHALAVADAGDGILISAITLVDLWYATQKRYDPLPTDSLQLLASVLAEPAVNIVARAGLLEKRGQKRGTFYVAAGETAGIRTRYRAGRQAIDSTKLFEPLTHPSADAQELPFGEALTAASR